MKRCCALLSLAISVLPATALASGDLFFQKLGIQVADFLVVLIPLLLVMIPLVRRSLKKRHEEVKTSIEAARREFDECSARLALAEEQLRNVNEQMESIRKSFRDLAADEKKAMELEVTETALKLRREAEMRINHAALLLQSQLADEVVTRALASVETRLTSNRPTAVRDASVDRITASNE